jgi:Ca2+-transporting ATPase
LCADRLAGDGTVAIDLAAAQAQAEKLAEEGLRVLAFALKRLPALPDTTDASVLETDLSFIGLVGLIDPPRPEAADAVAACQTAGIIAVMITGDHPATARAIATRLGIIGSGGKVLTGGEMAKLSSPAFEREVDSVRVYARINPEQKIRIVQALQDKGEFVAMTGDGVNDAPALKMADIGVAMGKGGTDVAREAAHMTLLDDNFATIEAAVEEGRGVFDNLTKFITWTLPTNVGEGLVILLAVFLGATLPILPVQILWINMTTALLLGLMLAFEPKEKDLMLRPPRDPASPILSRALLLRILIVGILAVLANFVADLVYAVLDPRIRVSA